MVLLRHGELGIHFRPNGVELIQREIPEFAQVMTKFWDNVTALPNWLTSIGKASEKVQEENPPDDQP